VSTPSIPNTPRSDRRYREMKNAVATFQTISAMVVAIAASVSPSMLMKTTPAMTLTAALRSAAGPDAARSVIVRTDNATG